MAINTLFQRFNAMSAGQLENMAVRRHFASHERIETLEAGSGILLFPLSGLLSVVLTLQNGDQVETGMVGREGAAGVLGAADALSEAEIVGQEAGELLALPAVHLAALLEKDEEARRLFAFNERFNCLQAESRAVCNAKHRVEERLASWLLMASEATASLKLVIVQEAIAEILGVQRASLSVSAGGLSRVGAIEYRRGHISISDRGILVEHACECHKRIARARLLVSDNAHATSGRKAN